MNYFYSSRKNLSYFFVVEVSNEMHVIAKSTNLHAYSYFSYPDHYSVTIKLLLFSSLMAF
jgi:hypothetical protein